MRGASALLPVRYKFKQVYPVAGSWSQVATSTPKKQWNNDSGEGGQVSNDKTDPIVSFSKPPPLPPVIGPLVVLSLLETWSSHDSNDD